MVRGAANEEEREEPLTAVLLADSFSTARFAPDNVSMTVSPRRFGSSKRSHRPAARFACPVKHAVTLYVHSGRCRLLCKLCPTKGTR